MKESVDPISEHLPKVGWLGDYVKFTNGLEACARFRFFSAACVLGAAINNKVWIQRGDPDLLPKLYPNLWVILLAPPGRGHKTSTIDMSVNALTAARDDVRLIADKITPESLIKALSAPDSRLASEMIRIGPRDATGIIKAHELSVFFGKQRYNDGLVPLITSLYDSQKEWKSATIARGGEVLRNICLTVLGGSTPDWLQHMLPQDAFTGGFMSRFLLVEMPINYFRKEFSPKKPSNMAWSNIVSTLQEISMLEGEMEWKDGGLEAYEKVYEGSLPTGETQLDAYRERESEQILKLAMLMAISENRLYVTESDMNKSKDIVYLLQSETNPRIERLTTHPKMQLTQEIKDLLKIRGEMRENDMLSVLYRHLEREAQFYEALSILKKSKAIEPIGKPGDYSYRLIKKGGQ